MPCWNLLFCVTSGLPLFPGKEKACHSGCCQAPRRIKANSPKRAYAAPLRSLLGLLMIMAAAMLLSLGPRLTELEDYTPFYASGGVVLGLGILTYFTGRKDGLAFSEPNPDYKPGLCDPPKPGVHCRPQRGRPAATGPRVQTTAVVVVTTPPAPSTNRPATSTSGQQAWAGPQDPSSLPPQQQQYGFTPQQYGFPQPQQHGFTQPQQPPTGPMPPAYSPPSSLLYAPPPSGGPPPPTYSEVTANSGKY